MALLQSDVFLGKQFRCLFKCYFRRGAKSLGPWYVPEVRNDLPMGESNYEISLNSLDRIRCLRSSPLLWYLPFKVIGQVVADTLIHDVPRIAKEFCKQCVVRR